MLACALMLCVTLQGCLLEQTTLQNEVCVGVGDVDRISISYTADNITILESEDDNLVLKEYLDNDDPEQFAQVTTSGSTIIIQQGARPESTSRSYVEVYLPARFSGQLSITTTTGSINIRPSLDIKNITWKSESGPITTSSISCDTMSVRTVSGRIDISQVSGDVFAKSVTSSIYIDDIDGSGSFESSSGTIDVSFVAVLGDITAANKTGKIKLYIPEDSRVALLATTTEGSIRSPFDDDEVAFESETRLRAEHGGVAGRHSVNLSTGTGIIVIDWSD